MIKGYDIIDNLFAPPIKKIQRVTNYPHSELVKWKTVI